MPDAVDRVKVLRLNVETQTLIEAAAAKIESIYGRVDRILNIAGVLGDGGDIDLGPERSLNKIDRGWMERTMSINTIGPVMFEQYLVPLMKRDRRGEGRTIITSLSARIGSISDNELGGVVLVQDIQGRPEHGDQDHGPRAQEVRDPGGIPSSRNYRRRFEQTVSEERAREQAVPCGLYVQKVSQCCVFS